MVDMDTDTNAGYLNVWQQCHTDSVAAVDINADKQQVSSRHPHCSAASLSVTHCCLRAHADAKVRHKLDAVAALKLHTPFMASSHAR